MLEKIIITSLATLFLCGFIFIIFNKLFEEFPLKSTLSPLISVKDLLAHYKKSFKIILKAKWLLFFPLIVVILDSAVRIGIIIYQYSPLNKLDTIFTNDTPVFILNKIYFKQMVQITSNAPSFLDYGFAGFINGYLFIGFFLICSLTFKSETNKLREHTNGQNLEDISFLENLMKLSLVFLLIIIILFFLLRGFQKELSEVVFLGPVMTVWLFFGLSILSIIEGCILLSVKGCLENKETNSKEVMSKALNLIKPLFFLNLIFALAGSLPSIYMYPNTINIFFPEIELFANTKIFTIGFYFFKHANSVFILLTFLTPFILMINNGNILEAFKKNLRFIGKHFLSYFSFVLSGVILLSIPLILYDVLGGFRFDHLIFSAFLEVFTVGSRVSLAVLFYIAFFDFYIQSEKTESTIDM